MPSALELRSERARVVGELRALIDRAEAENRDFSGEEIQTEERLQGEISALTSRIERQERADQFDRYNPTVTAEVSDRDGGGDQQVSAADEFRSFFAGKAERARTFQVERRDDPPHDLNKGTDVEGGYTVGEDFVTSLYEEMEEFSVIRQAGPTVLTTARGDDLLIPKTDDFSQAAIVGEGSTIGKSNPTFDQVKLGAYKYAFIMTASRELIEDTSVSNLIGFFAQQGGRALGDASGEHFVAGTGSGQPQGIITGATVGKEASATAALASDELFELYHSVIRAYRVRGTWLMHDDSVLAIRKLKDSDDNYLWQPGLQAGQPDRLLGRPVFPDPHVPTIEAGAKPIAFGDMSGYYVRDVGAVEVVRSDEYLFDSDQIAWRFLVRTDGKLVDTSAVKTLQMAAS